MTVGGGGPFTGGKTLESVYMGLGPCTRGQGHGGPCMGVQGCGVPVQDGRAGGPCTGGGQDGRESLYGEFQSIMGNGRMGPPRHIDRHN